MERRPFKSSRQGNYFVQDKKDIQFIHSGSELLDCVLGGGYALGRVSNIVGDKSSGKCVRDSFIISEGGLVNIDDVGQVMPEKDSSWEKELALDSDRTSKTSLFWKETVDFTWKVKTEHGFELIGTPDHKIMVLKKDLSFEMKPLSAIEEGDYAIIAPGTNMFSEEQVELNLKPLKAKAVHFSGIKVPVSMTQELAGLLGFFVADGTLSSGPAIITTHKKWARFAINHFTNLALGENVVREHIDGFNFSQQVREMLPQLFEVETMDGMTAKHKFVPPTILRSPKKVQRKFLKSLISCDSHIVDSGVEYSTASRRLAREVQMMLLNFGVVAILGEKWVRLEGWDEPRQYFNLRINGKRFSLFLEVIGTYKKVKREVASKDSSTYLTIPFAGDAIRKEITRTRKRLGWSRNGKLASGEYFPKTGAFAYRSPSMSHERLSRILEQTQTLLDPQFVENASWIAESNYIFEKVISKEGIKGKQVVCDVHVPKGHLFWSSGFISHNTLAAIETCANFAAQYPTGLICYHEAESAFDKGYAQTLGLPIANIEFPADADDMVYEKTVKLDEETGKKRKLTEEEREEEKQRKTQHTMGSDTIEFLFNNIVAFTGKCKAANVPGLYIIDSFDAMTSIAEKERKITDGSFSMEKQKKMSELFRRLIRTISRSRVHIQVISQIRDKIGVTFGEKTARTGGKALDFYASQVIWFSEIGKINKTIGKTNRLVGIKIKAKCKKNKVALPYRECEFPIMFGYGVDSITANLDFLSEAFTEKEKIAFQNTLVQTYNRKLLWSVPGVLVKKLKEVKDKKTIKFIGQTTKEVWKEIEYQFIPENSKY